MGIVDAVDEDDDEMFMGIVDAVDEDDDEMLVCSLSLIFCFVTLDTRL